MPTAPSKLAVVVRGGWNGHSPVEATDMFIPHLEANGFEVRCSTLPRRTRTRRSWPGRT